MAKRVKRNRYIIEFDVIDGVMTTQTEVTETAFKAMLKDLKRQVKEAEQTNAEYKPELLKHLTRETEGATIETFIFNCGCSDIYLTATTAKQGYTLI